MMNYYFNEDELYPMQNYTDDFGPQEIMFEKERIRLKDGTLPEFHIHTTTGPNELGPLQPNMPLWYDKVHYGLENWTMYRMLPQMILYDRALTQHLRNVGTGLMTVPNYVDTMIPQTLWAYYETLPKWCRDSKLVRNVLFAFEYNKPHMNFREKELAMNYMCA